jgi:hypothetical protein
MSTTCLRPGFQQVCDKAAISFDLPYYGSSSANARDVSSAAKRLPYHRSFRSIQEWLGNYCLNYNLSYYNSQFSTWIVQNYFIMWLHSLSVV